MNDIFPYLLKWSIALGVVFLFYRFALRPLTFYQWNRRYLLVYSLAAFLIPFINLYSYMPPEKLQDSRLVHYIPAITFNAGTAATGAETGRGSINPLFIAGMIILAGSLILLGRLVVQWYSLHRIRRQAVRLYHPEANLYHVDKHIIPFSFGNAIFVNTSLHTETELNDIILHEFVHVRQRHSLDIIWSEILCILNWYNPFAWFIRHAIRQNLEFIADQAVLQNGLDKKTYQYHLLKVIGSPQYRIANNFNFSSLKKRIAMMNRLKSARLHLVRFLFVLPLLAVLLVAFRNNNKGWDHDITTDTIKKPLTEVREIRLVPLKEFYKSNPSVKEVAWSDEEEIILYFKNGQRISYRLNDAEDMKKFRDTYGHLPTIISKPLPPHAALPPEVPVIQERILAQPPPPPPSLREPLKSIPPPAPTLPKGVASVEAVNYVMTITLENGKTETYDLSISSEKAAAEKKYGKLITISELPAIPKPTTAETPVIIEVPSRKASEPVIHLKGNGNEQASVQVIQDGEEGTAILFADEIAVHTEVPKLNMEQKEIAKAVYYLNGKRAAHQQPGLIAEAAEISHAEIISKKEIMVAQGEKNFNVIINFISKDNIHNKAAYLSKESIKVVEEAKKASRPQEPHDLDR